MSLLVLTKDGWIRKKILSTFRVPHHKNSSSMTHRMGIQAQPLGLTLVEGSVSWESSW